MKRKNEEDLNTHPPKKIAQSKDQIEFELAIREGSVSAAEALLKNKLININAYVVKEDPRDDDFTFINFSILKENLEMIELLLKNRAIIEDRNHCGESIHYAVDTGNQEIVKMLLKYKPSLDTLDDQAYTPLHLAVSQKSLDLAKLLLTSGAQTRTIADIEHQSMLSTAVENNDLAMVKLLIEYGAMINSDGHIDSYNAAPLQLAVGEHNLAIARFLLENGAKFDCKKLSSDDLRELSFSENKELANLLKEIESIDDFLFPLLDLDGYGLLDINNSDHLSHLKVSYKLISDQEMLFARFRAFLKEKLGENLVSECYEEGVTVSNFIKHITNIMNKFYSFIHDAEGNGICKTLIKNSCFEDFAISQNNDQSGIASLKFLSAKFIVTKEFSNKSLEETLISTTPERTEELKDYLNKMKNFIQQAYNDKYYIANLTNDKPNETEMSGEDSYSDSDS